MGANPSKGDQGVTPLQAAARSTLAGVGSVFRGDANTRRATPSGGAAKAVPMKSSTTLRPERACR
jgi:hypothetical protein